MEASFADVQEAAVGGAGRAFRSCRTTTRVKVKQFDVRSPN